MESATLTRPRTGRGWAARLRAVRAAGWAAAGPAALTVAALVGYVVCPTLPKYGSYCAMLWAREVLHLRHLSFAGYRTPTEHPLAILFSIPLVLLGQGGDRVLVFFCVASFVALAAGLYRLGRQSFGPLAGAVAAILVCSRFDFPFLAARGYIDIPYLALALWFAPRRAAMPAVLFLSGVGTFVLVALAGLSVIERYLLVPSLMVMVFSGVAVGGWTMLRKGTWTRRVWALGAAALVAFGVIFTVLRVNLASIDSELRFRGDAHTALRHLLSR